MFTPSASMTCRLLATVALLGAAALAQAQPTFANPSPTAGSSTADKANAAADAAAYKEVDYSNKAKRGPALMISSCYIPHETLPNYQTYSIDVICAF